ncbi:ABC-F family ATP-binding cassette domain-containing protein [Gottschalkiaceae bacterium SANA]|nr:ABC-F family ATP-binding cassette domain-containing protein [Gottschalkiaceae bacterium SANA]
MIVQLKEVSKSFGATSVLREMNMTIAKGEKIGIVGANGAGKTTIFHLITGKLSHDSGQVMANRKLSYGIVSQVSDVNPENTVVEECRIAFFRALEAEKEMKRLERAMADQRVYSDEIKLSQVMEQHEEMLVTYTEAGGFEMEGRIIGVLRGLGFKESCWENRTDTLSGGEKTKLTLAKLLLSRPDLLLLDEPTNHLDFRALAWLENFIREYEGTIALISHDRYFLNACVKIIYEIERGTAIRYAGNYTYFVKQRGANRAQYRKQYVAQQREIKRLETYVEKNIARASTSRMAKSRRKSLEKIERLESPLGDLRKMSLAFEMEKKSRENVLVFEDGVITVGDEDVRIPLLSNVNFHLKQGERMAVIGENGIGKSTLLKTLVGDHPLDGGSFTWGEDTEVGYYDQEHVALNGKNTIFEELLQMVPGISLQKVRTLLGQLLFPQDEAFKKISALSGGEKSRVVLAKLVLSRGNVLLLDEPTNHLDLPSKAILEKALRDYQGTLLFVSHDRYFINRVATRVMVLTKSGIEVHQGNYDRYLEKTGQSENREKKNGKR